MVKYENDCVGCPQGCIHCGNERVPYLYCDKCEKDAEELYKVDGEELCIDCLKQMFEKVEV